MFKFVTNIIKFLYICTKTNKMRFKKYTKTVGNETLIFLKRLPRKLKKKFKNKDMSKGWVLNNDDTIYPYTNLFVEPSHTWRIIKHRTK